MSGQRSLCSRMVVQPSSTWPTSHSPLCFCHKTRWPIRNTELSLCGRRYRNAVNRRGPLFCLPYGSDEAETPAMEGANQALLLASVADRPTRSIDPAGKRRFRHGSATPDRGQQIVLAHYTFAVINQKQEKIKNLRFDLLQVPSSAQLPPMSVNGIVFENQQQLSVPSPRDRLIFQPYGTPDVEKNQGRFKEKSMPSQCSFGRPVASWLSSSARTSTAQQPALGHSGYRGAHGTAPGLPWPRTSRAFKLEISDMSRT